MTHSILRLLPATGLFMCLFNVSIGAAAIDKPDEAAKAFVVGHEFPVRQLVLPARTGDAQQPPDAGHNPQHFGVLMPQRRRHLTHRNIEQPLQAFSRKGLLSQSRQDRLPPLPVHRPDRPDSGPAATLAFRWLIACLAMLPGHDPIGAGWVLMRDPRRLPLHQSGRKAAGGWFTSLLLRILLAGNLNGQLNGRPSPRARDHPVMGSHTSSSNFLDRMGQ
jgi:hypothetical protein